MQSLQCHDFAVFVQYHALYLSRPYSLSQKVARKKNCCPTSGTNFNLHNTVDFCTLNSISVVVTRTYLQFFSIS